MNPDVDRPATASLDYGPPGPTALYRYFDDQDVLLYVGISCRQGKREQGHIRSSPWMDCAARSTITRYPTRKEARAAEVRAIREERPVFNVADNESPEASRRRKEYEQGRPDVFAQRKVPVLQPNPQVAAPPSASRQAGSGRDPMLELAEQQGWDAAPEMTCPEGHSHKCPYCADSEVSAILRGLYSAQDLAK